MNEMVNSDANVTKDHVSLNTCKVDTRNITYFKCLNWNINNKQWGKEVIDPSL